MTPISIHALLAESDILAPGDCFADLVFLSTLSLRRATAPRRGTGACHRDFYPRSPCGERLCIGTNSAGLNIISIHALLAESDGRRPGGPFRLMLFLSTLSLRRATRQRELHWQDIFNFYPRSPCGERQINPASQTNLPDFYPRSPCGERRANSRKERQGQHISIHALLAESDWDWFFTGTLDPKFLSTLSLRRATSYSLLV